MLLILHWSILTPSQCATYVQDKYCYTPETMFDIFSQPIHLLNAEALVVATKEIGLEVNADKTKYMVMSREQTAGLSHTMKVDNSSIERVEAFEYLGTTLTNQSTIKESCMWNTHTRSTWFDIICTNWGNVHVTQINKWHCPCNEKS